jgi:predicted nucleic acid-binding protein
MKAVLDTNILIDYLSGYKEAEKENSLYKEPAISIISWMEVWDSATHKGLTLVTRNTKDFKASSPGIRIPYSLR